MAVKFALGLLMVTGASAFIAYGIEGKCKGFMCPDLQLDWVRYQDLIREDKVTLIPEDAGPNILAYQRFHAYDNTTGYYYFVATRPASNDPAGASYPPDARVFVLSTKNDSLIAKAQLDSSVYQNMTSLQFDSSTKTLYGIYENIVVTIDPYTGAQTEAFQMWDQDNTYLYNRIADYDSATGRLFMSVHNYRNDTYHIATFNTRTASLIVSPPVGYVKEQFSQNLPQGIAYDSNDGGVLLLTESRFGSGFERFDPATQTWKDIMDAENPEMQNYDAFDYSLQYGSLWYFHAPSNRFFTSLAYDDGNVQAAVLVQFDPVHLQIDDPWGTSKDFTNFVITQNDAKSA